MEPGAPRYEPIGRDDHAFGELLRSHRHDAGLSQEELADLAGLSVDAVASLERGRRRAPRPLTIRMLADALGLDDVSRARLARASRPELRPPLPGGLPMPVEDLVGRSEDLHRAADVLVGAQTRLLTLTGPGGVGKTRLAMALCARVVDRFAHGAHWVPLAAVRDGTAISTVLAEVLGARTPIGQADIDGVSDHIGGRETLLVLDNAEHVLDDCARTCAELLSRCTRLRIVVTSRELLRTPGELVQPVRPLPVAPPQAPPATLEASAAVRLFTLRAAARGFRPGPGQLATIATVCRRLDGIPLAIELAAARLNVLTIEQLDAALGDSLHVLGDGQRTAPRRHQTLTEAIAWSYELLQPEERRVLAQLSVFAGGWTLPSAETVCAAPPGTPTDPTRTVLGVIGRLVDKSLIVVGHDLDEARYDMLSVIRDFAQARLPDHEPAMSVAARHAHAYLDLVERGDRALHGQEQSRWLDRLEAELDNIRTAMAWLLRHRKADDALRMAGAQHVFCYLRGHYAEGQGWLESALALADAPGSVFAPPSRAKALLGAGVLAFLQCEYDLAAARVGAAAQAYRELGDTAGTASALQRLGSIDRERGHYRRAAARHEESAALCAEIGDTLGVAWSNNYLSFVAWLAGDHVTARSRAQAALDVFGPLGDTEGLVWALINSGVVALAAGDLAAATAVFRDSLAMSERLGYLEGMAWAHNELGLAARRRGDLDEAQSRLQESLATHHELGDRWRTASLLEQLASIALIRDRPGDAALLDGAAAALRDRIGAPVPVAEEADHDDTVEAARSALGAARFTALWSKGSVTPLPAIIDGMRDSPLRPG